MKRVLQLLAAALLSGIVQAQVAQPLRAGQELGPFSESCVTMVTIDGVAIATLQPGQRLTVPPLSPSLCGLTVRLCVYESCGGEPQLCFCTSYVLEC